MSSQPPQLNQKIEEFKIKLGQRLAERRQGKRAEPSFVRQLFDNIFARLETAGEENKTLTVFGRFTLKDKRQVIEKLVNELNGDASVTYTERDIDAARQGNLGDLVAQYADFLPKNFIQTERKFQIAMETRLSEKEFLMRR